MSLRKAGKANWHYDCRLCHYTSPAFPDQLRAEERGLQHERGYEHLGKVLEEALEPVQEAVRAMADAWWEMGKTALSGITDAMDQMAAALAPPTNVPHDPAQRRDKRTWGGK